jgi:phosphatidylserine decarboxylase
MEVNDAPQNLIAFTQIAGIIARRIICDAHEGQEIGKGEIFGLIRFGSRCDIWLPVNVAPKISKGQTMIGGESIIADLSIKDSKLLECAII